VVRKGICYIGVLQEKGTAWVKALGHEKEHDMSEAEEKACVAGQPSK
jgi:hypothetical protein